MDPAPSRDHAPDRGQVHVVGAGLAGLSAAVRLTEAGWPVTVYESAGHAGGRCRSYFDDTLGCRIDNGNHLLLAGNRSAMAYLDALGARDALETVAPARIPFVDLETGERWTLRPNAGPVGWWVLAPGRRAPGTSAGDYLGAVKLRGATGKTMAELFDRARPAFRRFWEPMAVAVLNTAADEAAAGLLWPVMTEIVLRGEAAFRPCIAGEGLSEAFVDPALAWLAARGAQVRFNTRCRAVEVEDGRAAALDLGGEKVALGAGDRVVLAVPPAAARTLLPDLTVPDDFRPIVNVHFRCAEPLPMPGGLPLLGLIGGTAQWIFRRGEIASVTISAATAEAELPADDLLARVWADIRRALGLGDRPAPPARILTEKRATIAQTPAQAALRPAARTPLANLFLAGDWTDTGLPATIEGRIPGRASSPPVRWAHGSVNEACLDRGPYAPKFTHDFAPGVGGSTFEGKSVFRLMLKPAQAVRPAGQRRAPSEAAPTGESPPDVSAVDKLVDDVRARLSERQQDDGHWVFELEADATIPAEYVLYKAFLAEEIDPELEAKIGNYLRRIQGEHGGWPLFHDGDFDMSASVKAYYALKLIGDDTAADHMTRARDAILAHGGAETSNVFTRILLALFGQVPWRAVPVMPVEIMLLPRWFPFHLSKVSYWSRTVIAPLLVLMTEKPQAANPKRVGIRELFVTAPEKVRKYHANPTGSVWGAMLLRIDTLLRVVEPRLPRRARQRAIDRAMAFTRERLNGEDGLGAIFPAMVNAVEAMVITGVPEDDPDLVTAKHAIEKLLVVKEDEAYCQPCVSPIWDTGLAAHAMLEAGIGRDDPKIKAAADWLLDREITDLKGDWAWQAPDLKPGGWAFQYRNDHYPDVDDTAVVGMALHRLGDPKYAPAVERAAEWIVGMQSKNGGWGAFDINNDKYYLNHIPFADHGALLDPPTADVSARCLSFLCQIGYGRENPTVARAIDYLKAEQEEEGSWFGRWGTNYIYGTWSVLCALNAAGEDMDQPYIRRAVDWLKAQQNADGGWGEDGATYWQERRGENKASTPSQTAWALMGLMATGDIDDPAVERGVAWLDKAPRDGARWEEDLYTAVGFPRVFYLRYHGYAAYFPLWALARYRNLKRANDRKVAWGM